MQRKIIITLSDELSVPSNLQMPGARVAFVVDGANVESYAAQFSAPQVGSRASKSQSFQNLYVSASSVTIEEASPVQVLPAADPVASVVETSTEEQSADFVEEQPEHPM
jgi:hypothetical protein